MDIGGIPFNKPYLTGKEIPYIRDAVETGKISGNGRYTNLCHQFFKKEFGFKKCLLTSSCTDALEMAALLLNIQQGDEVIMPSFTFVSTANAFVLRGAKIVFADSGSENPNINVESIENLINEKTIAIVVVHYAGNSCDMDKVMQLATQYKLKVIEDAAQAIESFYINKCGVKKALGSIGHLAAFSFHETKNIISGEGGMLVINDQQFEERAEIIWEKGTNRSAFFRGEVDKYNWVDVGSSFLPSEITSAFLFAQLEHLQIIQARRLAIWNLYYCELKELENEGVINLPKVPECATNNGHMFYIVCKSSDARERLMRHLKDSGILAVSHYISLHKSPFYHNRHDGRILRWSDLYSERLLRLPFFFELSDLQVLFIVKAVKFFFQKQK